MKIKQHRLYHSNGKIIPLQKTSNHGLKLVGGKPRFIILHYTAGPSAKNAISWLKDKQSSASAHLIIDHDGSTTQMIKFDTVGWHAGRSTWNDLVGLNQYSVGIEIANWGSLIGQSGNWRSWTGVPLPEDRVIMAAHKNQSNRLRAWEQYDPAQIKSTMYAVQAIASYYDISPDNILGHDDISPARKLDPGPAWEMDRFRSRTFGRNTEQGELDVFMVMAAKGLNLRIGPGIRHDKIMTLSFKTEVAIIEALSTWWLVAEIENGNESNTGWVHSRWLSKV